jgi:uncharacterized hydrophobic protein (TIGR00271 family)
MLNIGRLFRMTAARREAMYEEIVTLSRPTTGFYILVVVSSTIAAYGLLANSTAVVIGAMLVAPLMGPIFGIALGLVAGDRRLLGRAVAGETLGVLLAVAVGWLAGISPLRLDPGAEILARTQPNLYDLIIALAAGLAGAYAISDKDVSPALPGVAISVALVPPLVTCGICLALRQPVQATGAMLLFVANLLAIQIASATVFAVAGAGRPGTRKRLGLREFCGRFGLSLLALALVAVFMTHTLIGLVSERRLTQAIEHCLREDCRAVVGAELMDMRYQETETGLEVIATMLTPSAFQAAQVERLRRGLQRVVGRPTHLIVRSLPSRDYDHNGPVYLPPGALQRQAEDVRAQEQARRDAELHARTTTILAEGLADTPGASLDELRREQYDGRSLLTAVVRTPTTIGPETVAGLQEAIHRATDGRERLIVRSVLTRDADAEGFIYEPDKPEPPEVSPAEPALKKRLGEALRSQLRRRLPGAHLLEMRLLDGDGQKVLLATVRAPSTPQATDVAAIEADFRRHIDPRLRLVVRSQVGADTYSGGYLESFDPEQGDAVPQVAPTGPPETEGEVGGGE